MAPRTVLVLGGGIGGLVTANELRRRLDPADRVVVVERERQHLFQPSLLWLMVGFVVLIVWAVGAASRGGTSREPERPTALDILRERYARGEITQLEFEQAKKTLGY
jgi:hypothetical protein